MKPVPAPLHAPLPPQNVTARPARPCTGARRFVDTIVICSCTAMIMLLAPKDLINGLSGMDLLQTAMQYHLGKFGVIFIALTLFLFSFSTFLGILFYARSNVAYLFGDKWCFQTAYKVLALVMLFIGGIAAYTLCGILVMSASG